MSEHVNKWDKRRWGTLLVATDLAEQRQIYPVGTKGILLAEKATLLKVVPENRITAGWYAREFWTEASDE